GTYTVRLTVNGPEGTSTITKVDYIIVGDSTTPVLQAEFSASGKEGNFPLETSFRDRSSGDNIQRWSWDFDNDDEEDSNEQSPTHIYTAPGNYTVSLTVTDINGNFATQEKTNYVVASVFDSIMDNVDYPKTHYRSKTILFRKELEIDKTQLKYSRFFYDSCNSGNYYLTTFNRGMVFYTLGNSGLFGFNPYVKAYLEGKSDQEIWEIIQEFEPVYDYYDFNKFPDEQQPEP
ncbi:PKD domain-containing protein, partial [bacterium]|nr:PKD domain-containing protein [bacterium]